MCQTNFKPCKYITNEYIDYNMLIEFVNNVCKLQLTPKYAKTVITQSRGCVKCFFTRLILHIRNEKEIIEFYNQKYLLRARAELYVLFFNYLVSKNIISTEEAESVIKEFFIFLKK